MSPFKVVPSSSAYGNAFQVFHYIAPLYGDFNPSFSKDSAIFFENRGKTGIFYSGRFVPLGLFAAKCRRKRQKYEMAQTSYHNIQRMNKMLISIV